MELDKENIITTKVRLEDGKEVKYVITNDSFTDEYGSFKGDYNAWRIEGKEVKRLTCDNYYNTQSAAERCITFGYHVKCECCGHIRFVNEEDYEVLPVFYSQKEVDELVAKSYNKGYKAGRKK